MAASRLSSSGSGVLIRPPPWDRRGRSGRRADGLGPKKEPARQLAGRPGTSGWSALRLGGRGRTAPGWVLGVYRTVGRDGAVLEERGLESHGLLLEKPRGSDPLWTDPVDADRFSVGRGRPARHSPWRTKPAQ